MAGLYEGKLAKATGMVLKDVGNTQNAVLKKVLAASIQNLGQGAKMLDKAMEQRDAAGIEKSAAELKNRIDTVKSGIDKVIQLNGWPPPAGDPDVRQISIEKQVLGTFKNKLTYLAEDTQDAKGALMNGPLASLVDKDIFTTIEAPLKSTDKLIKGLTKDSDAICNPLTGKKDAELSRCVQDAKTGASSLETALKAMTAAKKKTMNMAEARTLLTANVSDVIAGLKKIEDACKDWKDSAGRIVGKQTPKNKKAFDNLVKIAKELEAAANKDQDTFVPVEQKAEKLGRAA